MRARLLYLVESRSFQRTVMSLVVLNAVVLGLETSSRVMGAVGAILRTLDVAILAFFVVEIILRVIAYGPSRFFRDPWSVFDFVVVAVAVVPAAEEASILRALRVLRLFRLVSVFPRMRGVVEALLAAIPGLGAIVALLGLIFYVGGVMATNLFGAAFPEWFGTLARSIYTLFQIMTLESWSMGIVRPVMEVHAYAWLFFVPFILVATFTMLNLFIAVVVNAMQQGARESEERTGELVASLAQQETEALRAELDLVRGELARIRELIERGLAPPPR